MKFGLVTPYVDPLPGGVNQHVRYLYENLRLRGHDRHHDGGWQVGQHAVSEQERLTAGVVSGPHEPVPTR